MASTKLLNLQLAENLNGDELLLVMQDGKSRKTTISDIQLALLNDQVNILNASNILSGGIDLIDVFAANNSTDITSLSGYIANNSIDITSLSGNINNVEASITNLENYKAGLNNPTFTGDSTKFNDKVRFDERVVIKPASGLGLKLESSGTSRSAINLDVRGTAKVGHDLFKHSGFTNGFGSGSNHFHSIFRINRIEQVNDQDQVWTNTGGDIKNIERAQERYYATQTNVLRNNSAAFWAWHRVARPISSPTINTNNATLDVGLLEISQNRDSKQQKLWSLNTTPDGKSEKITINNLVNHTFSVGDHVRMEFSVSFPGPIVASKRFGKVTDVDDANTLRVELYGGNYKTTAEVPVPADGIPTQTALPFRTEDGDRHVKLEKIENSSAINSGDEHTLVFYDKNNFTPARLKNETVKATWNTAHGLIRNEHVTIMLDGSTLSPLVPAESGWVLDPDPDGDGLSAILIYGGRRTKQYNIPSAFSDFTAGQWRIYKGTLDGLHQDVIGDNLLTFVSDNVGNYKAYEIGPGCQADSDCISFGRSIYNKDSKTIKIGYDKPMLDVRSDGVVVEEDLTVKGDTIFTGTVAITDLASVGTGNLEFSSAASVNITAADDVNISGTARFSDIFELPPLSSAPVAPTAGTFATADLTNWDPAAKGTGRAYPVFYDGAVWQPLY